MPAVVISLDQQIKEVQRELDMRRRKYPKWVVGGTLSPVSAARQIAILEAVELTLMDKKKTGEVPPKQVVQMGLFLTKRQNQIIDIIWL